jgi:predicted transposase/invertase (TIGR01784 family)
MRELALSDWTSGVNQARREGIQEGMQEGMWKGRQEGIQEGMRKGIREEKIEIARNLKTIGVQAEKIAEATGLSADEIAKL